MTEATKPAAPLPGTPEWDAAMIAKAETGGVTASHTDAAGNVESLDGAPPPAPTAPEAPAETPADETPPALILGKFKTQADLEAAYKALETKLGAPKVEPKLDAEGKPIVETPPVPETPALATLSDKATEELSTTGKVSDETYAGFEKAGISRAQLDAYVEGQKAVSMIRVQTVQAEVGGADQYTAMVQWAATGLTPAEQVAFDQAVLGADDGVRMMAVRGLQARYVAENGKGGNLVKPRASSESIQGELFRSRAEMTTAMKDPRYTKDAAYRADVERRVLNTSNAGIDLWG